MRVNLACDKSKPGPEEFNKLNYGIAKNGSLRSRYSRLHCAARLYQNASFQEGPVTISNYKTIKV